jgi:hypothetical protein
MTNQAEFEHAVAANSSSTPDTPLAASARRPRRRCGKALRLRWARFWSASISTGHLEQTDHGTRLEVRGTPGAGSSFANTTGKRRCQAGDDLRRPDPGRADGPLDERLVARMSRRDGTTTSMTPGT